MLIIYYFQWIHNHNFWRIDYFFDFVQPNKKTSVFPRKTLGIRMFLWRFDESVSVQRTKPFILYSIGVPGQQKHRQHPEPQEQQQLGGRQHGSPAHKHQIEGQQRPQNTCKQGDQVGCCYRPA